MGPIMQNEKEIWGGHCAIKGMKEAKEELYII